MAGNDTTHASAQRDRGFSLVELLIVIVVLGVLASVTVFTVRGLTNRGEAATCSRELRGLASVQELYHADAREFGTAAELVAAERLRSNPVLFTITVAADGQGYRLDGVGTCVGITSTTGTPP